MATLQRSFGAIEGRKTASEETIDSILRIKGSNVWHVAPEQTVFEAIAAMADHGIGALPVVSKDELVGIITERDYARKIILQGRSSLHTPVSEIMTPTPLTVTPDFTVNQCMHIMTKRRIRHLPVVDRGTLVGIVSIGDLVNAIMDSQAFTIEQLTTYISADYPG